MKRKIKIFAIYLCVTLILLCIHYILLVVVFLCIIINRLLIKHICKINSSIGKKQNVDCLIIGDRRIYNKINGKNEGICDNDRTIVLLSPIRTLISSYELIRTLFSLVREDGKGTIEIYADEKSCKGYTLYDAALLHPTSLYKIGIHFPNILRKYPLWCYLPFKLISYIYIQNHPPISTSELICEMKSFCTERNVNIIIHTL